MATSVTHLVVVLSTFAFCLGGALVPVLHAEAYLVAASLLAPPDLYWPLVIAATCGQMLGKVGMYFAGRGALQIPGARMQRQIQKASARVRERGEMGSGLVFVSAALGFPPFYLLSIAAGIVRFPLPAFIVYGFAGRFLRFSLAVFLPHVRIGDYLGLG